MITTTWTQLQGALWSLSVVDSRAQAGVAAASCAYLHTTQSRDVMGLCQLEETGLQLRVWVSLAPSLPPRRTLVSLPKVLQVNSAGEENLRACSQLARVRGLPPEHRGEDSPLLTRVPSHQLWPSYSPPLSV